MVSCPGCERLIELPDGVRPGATIRCCGVDWRLTYEFGSYALER